MKTDARVRYTKRMIKSSFLKLLAKKPIKEITVKEICALAEINRATFYTHYQDAYHLLEEIEDELFEDISSTVTLKQDDIYGLVKEIFAVIEKNIELCRILFSENGDKMFLRRIMDIAREKQIAEIQRQYPHATRIQLNYLYEFLASGSVAVVTRWVQYGMQETPLALGEAITKVNDLWLNSLK